MQILINANHTITDSEALNTHLRSVVEAELGHLASHLTRIEVHVTDDNGPKNIGLDKRCAMEGRLIAHQPVAVVDHAATVYDAVTGAADKLARLIEHTLGRIDRERAHRTDPEPTNTAVIDEPGSVAPSA